MSTRHKDHDGSDIFWPGYVDAVTNLVLNLLFLLTIMTVAVFMFALELGRASKLVSANPPVATAKQDVVAPTDAASAPVVEENLALKREIQRLNMKLAQQVSPNVPPVKQGQAAAKPVEIVKPLPPVELAQPESSLPPGGPGKTVDATSNIPKPLNGLDKALASDSEVLVRFKDEAVAFTAAERELLLKTLKPIVVNGKASINVVVPAGFSEAKRMGFYRAMAVRNLLIEMKMPKENIDVSVLEGKNNASASLVRVR